MGRIAGVSPEETRERLLEAAARVFESKGFEGATVAEIAREAGVTSGAIYAHFQSKAALLAESLRCHSDEAMEALIPPGSQVDVATLLSMLGHYLNERDPTETALLSEALLAARRDAEVAQIMSAGFTERVELMTALVQADQARGLLSQGFSARAHARMSLMIALGSMLVSQLDLPAVDRDEWNDLIDRMVGVMTEGDTDGVHPS